MRLFFITMTILLSTLTLTGQHHYLLDDFRVFKEKDRVILNWTLKKGSTCVGTGILRSTDGVNYEVIGEYQGICGSNESAQSYNFIDESPVKNAKNYYLLELGFSGKTDPALVIEYIDISKENYKVIPNPTSDVANIYFDNPTGENHILRLYDSAGSIIKSYKSSTDIFIIDVSNSIERNFYAHFSDKMYFFMIAEENGQPKLYGKLLVVH